MIALIITLALVGLIVYLITTYIPMPDIFKKVIMVVVVILGILAATIIPQFIGTTKDAKRSRMSAFAPCRMAFIDGLTSVENTMGFFPWR